MPSPHDFRPVSIRRQQFERRADRYPYEPMHEEGATMILVWVVAPIMGMLLLASLYAYATSVVLA